MCGTQRPAETAKRHSQFYTPHQTGMHFQSRIVHRQFPHFPPNIEGDQTQRYSPSKTAGDDEGHDDDRQNLETAVGVSVHKQQSATECKRDFAFQLPNGSEGRRPNGQDGIHFPKEVDCPLHHLPLQDSDFTRGSSGPQTPAWPFGYGLWELLLQPNPHTFSGAVSPHACACFETSLPVPLDRLCLCY